MQSINKYLSKEFKGTPPTQRAFKYQSVEKGVGKQMHCYLLTQMYMFLILNLIFFVLEGLGEKSVSCD